MVSTTDPECMTVDERRQEVAAILAAGLLRRVRMARTADKTVSEVPRNRLEARAEPRLSVAPRPAG